LLFGSIYQHFILFLQIATYFTWFCC